jgi:hypothetical protein
MDYIYSSKTRFGSLKLEAVYFIEEEKEIKLKEIKTKSINYTKDDDLEEKIAELVNYIRFDNRPRVTEQNIYGGFGGMF